MMPSYCSSDRRKQSTNTAVYAVCGQELQAEIWPDNMHINASKENSGLYCH